MNIDFNKRHKEKYMGDLGDFIDKLISERNTYVEVIRSYNADEKVANVLKENERIRTNSLHVLSEKEKVDADAFRKKHWDSCRGNTRYILEGTGIGTAVGVQCTKCGIKDDITDHENW